MISKHRIDEIIVFIFVVSTVFLLGGIFMLDDAKVQTFLKGHGSAEFQAYCEAILPMYKQCSGTT